MDEDGVEGKSQFGGSAKRARTGAPSRWGSQVFSDDEAEADVRTKLGAATLSAATRKPGTAGDPFLCLCICLCLYCCPLFLFGSLSVPFFVSLIDC